MSRTGRVLVVVAAWFLPVAWVTGALLAGPCDGTVVSTSALDSTGRWGSTVTIVDVVGERSLQPGDVVQSVDGKPFGDWAAGDASAEREVGDPVQYEIVRPAPDLDRNLDVEVTLVRYPIIEAVGQNAATVLGFGMVLLAASVVFWRRPDGTPQRAFLVAAALLPAWLTASPLGPGVIDLAGSRGTWPALVGGLLCALGLGAAVVAATTLGPSGQVPRRARKLLPLALLPFVGYAVWLLVGARGLTTEAARLQGLVTIVPPALIVVVPTVVVLLCWRYARSDDRATRLATRLALIGILGGVVGRILLGDLPQLLTGDPLLPGDVLVLLITPAVLGCLVVAVDGYRLAEVEPTVRRAIVQAAAVAVVATSFVAVAAAIGRASDIGFRSLLAGGVLALLVLPLAVALQRLLRRMVYGDREFPRRVVSDLRQLDPTSAPQAALTETLSLLARRLRLSYAAIDVRPPAGTEPVAVSFGESRGNPVAVDLVAGGVDLGRLLLEVSPQRDPFGPGDRRLLEDVGVQVGALVQAVLVNRELQRSRQHLVSAREEERRRLRRDLHDGLGPSLATLAMRLESVSDLIERDPAGAAELADTLSEQARAEILEVRRLVDGLRPPALDQLGLVSALRQRAEQHRVPGAPEGHMTWTVEARDDVEPLPAAVEVAAYRITLEAVTNALRHSGAETCTVTLVRLDGTLLLTVRDTGRGLAADPRAGVGLTSMRERAEELGGSCTVTSDDRGTVVEVRLPISWEGGG
jgi:two-component system, NarL family, sensor kinase